MNNVTKNIYLKRSIASLKSDFFEIAQQWNSVKAKVYVKEKNKSSTKFHLRLIHVLLYNCLLKF